MLENKQSQDQLLKRLEAMQAQDDLRNQLMNQDFTSQMSSINQSLLDDQASIAISQAFDVEHGSSQSKERSIKEAIIDLYLAIKIRSTEELDRINDGNLMDEKEKLMLGADCYQILEYIRSSIEIIMNLKIEDLEKNDGKKKR